MKKLLSLLLSTIFLFCSNISAQTFLSLSATDYPITEQLPHVVQQYQVVEANNYEVKLLYPEYVPLTHKEQHILLQHNYPKINQPKIHLHKKVSRKQTFVNIDFVPIVHINGKWQRLVHAAVNILPTDIHVKASSHKETTSRYTSHSVLSKGKWHKIYVDKEGIYQLSASSLRKMGFNDIKRVKVYGYGGRILPENFSLDGSERLVDDLCEVATELQGDKRLLFFAEGTRRMHWDTRHKYWTHEDNYYSKHSYYFLTEGNKPLRITNNTSKPNAQTPHIDSVIACAIYERDQYAWFEGGRQLYDGYDFINGNTNNFTLSTPDAVTDKKANINIAFSAASSIARTNVKLNVNEAYIGYLNIDRFSGGTEKARESTKTFTVNNLYSKKKNNITFKTTQGHHARLNYISISYARKLTSAPFVFMPSTVCATPSLLHFHNITTEGTLWRLPKAGTPTTRMPRQGNDFYVDAPYERYIYVNNNNEFPSPQYAGVIANQDLHADAATDMVVILPTSNIFDTEAQRLIDKHRQRGLRVNVVHADQLYNEFSSGTPDATAYRRYLKMLYDRAENDKDMPRYLLLFGACNWDNRFLITRPTKTYNPDNLLLAYEVSSKNSYGNSSIGTLESYVTDDYFGLLDDGEGRKIATEAIDISIGRILCTKPEEARILVNKSIAYLENKEAGDWRNKVIFMGDYGDNNLHMHDAEVAANLTIRENPSIDVEKIYWDAYTCTPTATGNSFPEVTKLIQRKMRFGALMFNYSGHGSPSMISHAKVLTIPDFELPGINRLPLWVFASCEITPYDRHTDDIGRTALYNPTGGALAVIAASRSVYSTYNRSLNEMLCHELFVKKTNGTLQSMGDALRQTKLKLINTGEDRSINKLKYILLGDPSIPLAAPTLPMQINSINGESIKPNSNLQLSAGQHVRFSGYIGQNGVINTNFTGKTMGTLYDCKRKITCKNNPKFGEYSSQNMVYNTQGNMLFSGADSVRKGKFALNVIIPRDISYSELKGMLRLYAIDNSKKLQCHGFNTNFHLDGAIHNDEITKKGPKVKLYFNNPTFPNGGQVSTAPLFYATIEDPNGINAIGGGIGHNITLTIDNNPLQSFVLNPYFQYDFGKATSGTICYQLNNLTPGHHTLSLRVFSINDNSTTAHLDFNVTTDFKPNYQLSLTANPIRTTTTFIATLPTAQEEHTAKVNIYNLNGTLLWSGKAKSKVGSHYISLPWNACNFSNQPLNNGLYICQMIIKNESKTIKKLTRRFIINR